jgi:hypothetical protein
MKKNLFIIIVLLFSAFSNLYAGDFEIPEKITGLHYNDVWEKWFDAPVKVSVDSDNLIYVKGGGGFITATGRLKYSEVKTFKSTLEKGIAWSEVARQKKVNVEKEIGSFFTNPEKKQGIIIVFLSSDSGNKTEIVLDIVGYDNPYYKIKIHMSPKETRNLITALNRIPWAINELRKREANEKLFQ